MKVPNSKEWLAGSTQSRTSRPDGLQAYLMNLRAEGWKVLSIGRPPDGHRHGVRARRTVTAQPPD